MKFILSYPSWFILFCFLLGAGFALLLYYRDKKIELSRNWRWLLAALRFISISCIAFLLLEPLVRTEKRTVEKPIIVIAQDNSESLLLAPDSSQYKQDLASKIEALKTSLEENYTVQTYTIGNELREGIDLTFEDKSTNLSQLFEELNSRFYNRNLGAVVLLSDGIYNTGNSPVNAAQKLKGVPIYSVLLGDTTIRKDQLVLDLAYNRLAYLGNEFPVEVLLSAKKMNGEKMEVLLEHNGTTIQQRSFLIDRDDYTAELKLKIDAKQTGMQHYRIHILEHDNELSKANNYQDFYVEVLNSKQKIAIIGASPHPDIAALKLALSKNINYDVSTYSLNEFNQKVEDFNLLVLHQIPTGGVASGNLIASAKKESIPVLYILGSQSDLIAFNGLATGITLNRFKNINNTVNGYYNSGFTSFNVDATAAKKVFRYPPLQVPFGEWTASPAVSTLFFQRIGTVETGYPLIAFNNEIRQKTGVILGEGIWRWRLAEFANSGNSDFVDEIIQKCVQFLANKEKKSRFKVFGKTNFMEDEKIRFDAEFYNESFELNNEPDVQMLIHDKENKEFRYVFSRSGNAYRLDAGRLPVGKYTYDASVQFNKQTFTAKGLFTVSPVQLELLNAIANHQVLTNLSHETKGETTSLNEMQKISEWIKNKEEIVEVVYRNKQLDTILNFKWIFFFIVLFLASEWFIRKWSGAY